MNFVKSAIKKAILQALKPAKNKKIETSAYLLEALAGYPHKFKEFSSLLKIQTKGLGVIPFNLNPSQIKHYDFFLNKYENAEGLRVYYNVIKFRQCGHSTYSVIFFIYNCLANRWNGAIEGANDGNTQGLFKMCLDFLKQLEGLGLEVLRHPQGEEIVLKFDGVELSFYFSNASGKGRIRGKTIGCLLEDELSKVLLTQYDEGASQALFNHKNALRIGLGTPEGVGNRLHAVYKNSNKEDLLFLAWWEFDDNINNTYQVQEIDEDERRFLKYIEERQLNSLSQEKINWLRVIYNDFKGFNKTDMLDREYPPSIEVGFELSGENTFASPVDIMEAFNPKEIERSRSVIIGVDLSGGGKDKTTMAVRYGNYIELMEIKQKSKNASEDFTLKASEIIEFCLRLIRDNYNIEFISYDATGLGYGFGTALESEKRKREIEINKRIPLKLLAVNFASGVNRQFVVNGEIQNKKIGIREFMYFEIKRWLETGRVFITSANKMNIELCKEELSATKVITRNGAEKLLTKEDIKANINRSPDFADALALTFQPESTVVNIKPNEFKPAKQEQSYFDTFNHNPESRGIDPELVKDFLNTLK